MEYLKWYIIIKIDNKYNNLILNNENDNLWHRRLGYFYHKDLSKFVKRTYYQLY